MLIKCSRCRNRADYIDCFHPWQDEYTLCKRCLPTVEKENLERIEQPSSQNESVFIPYQRPTSTETYISYLPKLMIIIILLGGIILHLVKELL